MTMTKEPAALPATHAATTASAARSRSLSWKAILMRPEAGALGGTILVFALFLAVAPPLRQLPALSTVLYQAATLGIPAVAVALLMIGGEFDLTAGVAVTTASLAASMFSTSFGLNLWFGVAFSLALALGIGALNGYLLARTRLHSFLVTLATFLMLQGANIALTRLITGNVATADISMMPGYDSAHAVFASNLTIGHTQLSIAILYWLLLVVIGTWFLLRTRFGNWVFAVGGQSASARAMGVPVARTKTLLFMLVGFSVWLLGMQMLFTYDTVQSGAGRGNELVYIAAAVVGGCLMTGGYGSAVGSALGVLIFGVTIQGVIYADWNPDWFTFFVGATLLAATVFNNWVRARSDRGE
jgi:simple sugar transport system permease protein